MKKIELGILTKPQGLKGEFRLKNNINTFKLCTSLKNIIIDDNNYLVIATTDRGGFFVIKTKEITSIDQVENMRGKTVYCLVEDDIANAVNNNVGYSIVANGNIVGVVESVNNYGSTDVYFLDNGKSLAVVPNLILSVDDDKKQVIVDADILNEVIV